MHTLKAISSAWRRLERSACEMHPERSKLFGARLLEQNPWPHFHKEAQKGQSPREGKKSLSHWGAGAASTPSTPGRLRPPRQPGEETWPHCRWAAPREPIQSALTDWPPAAAAVRRRPSERARPTGERAVCKQLAGRVEPAAYLLSRAGPAAFFAPVGRPARCLRRGDRVWVNNTGDGSN